MPAIGQQPNRDHQHGQIEPEPQARRNCDGEQGEENGRERVPGRIRKRQNKNVIGSDARQVGDHLRLSGAVVERDALQEAEVGVVENLEVEVGRQGKRQESDEKAEGGKQEEKNRRIKDER